MNRRMWIFLLLTSIGYASKVKAENLPQYAFGRSTGCVSIQSKASTLGMKVGCVAKNESVKLITKTTYTVISHSIESPWYLIMDSSGVTGWVHGSGLIIDMGSVLNIKNNLPLRSLEEDWKFPIVPAIQYSTIVYHGSDGLLYYKNDLLGKSKKIGEGFRPALYPDRSKIAYIKRNSSKDTNGSLVIYDLILGTTRQIVRENTRFEYIWLSNPIYMAVKEISNKVEACSIYNLITLEHLMTIPDFSNEIVWLDKETLAIQTSRSLSYKVEKNVYAKLMTEITMVDMKKLKTKVIAKANPLKRYRIISRRNNGLIYAEEIVKEWSDWEKSEKIMTTYWLWSTKNKSQINSEEAFDHLDSYETLLNAYSMKDLDSQYAISSLSQHPRYGNWMLFMLYSKDLYKVQDLICITNVLDPIGSIRKIAEGSDSGW